MHQRNRPPQAIFFNANPQNTNVQIASLDHVLLQPIGQGLTAPGGREAPGPALVPQVLEEEGLEQLLDLDL